MLGLESLWRLASAWDSALASELWSDWEWPLDLVSPSTSQLELRLASVSEYQSMVDQLSGNQLPGCGAGLVPFRER